MRRLVGGLSRHMLLIEAKSQELFSKISAQCPELTEKLILTPRLF